MTLHKTSLAAKLATLAVGDVIYLPDDAPAAKPTQMERQVQDRLFKLEQFDGWKISTSRCDAVTPGRTLEHILRVERHK